MDAELESRPGGRRSGTRRRTQRTPRKLRAELGLVALALALLTSGLGFGAQHRPVLLVAAALSAVAAALSPAGFPLSRLAKGLLALAAFTALQALPLPFGLVQALSPASAEVWAGAVRPFHESPPAWVSLSVDPAATWLEALKFTSYAALAVAGAGLRARRGSPWVAALVFSASLAACLVTLAHGIVRAPLIYGVFPPVAEAERWTRGPFVNSNNLAAYLNVGLFAGAGLWLGGRSPLPVSVTGIGVPLLAAGVVLGGSRGGVVSLLVAAAVLVAITVSRKTAPAPRALVGLGVVLVVAALGLLVLGDERLWQSLFDTGLSGKIMAFRWTLPMIADFWPFGVGRGAFGGAFQPYRGARGDASTVYEHAENLVLDWVAEWGVPVGALALVGLFAVSGLLALRARKDSTLTGLATGILAVLVGGTVDFGIEIFGIAALVVVVLSTAETASTARAEARPWLRFVPAVAVLVALTITIGGQMQPVRTDRKTLRDTTVLASRSVPRRYDEVWRELHAATLRHPGDGYLPLIGAYVATQERKNALVWLGRALERNPRSGTAHFMLGEALGQLKKPAQALIHLRLAATYTYALSDAALRYAVTLESDPEALSRAFPSEVVGGSAFVDLCPRIAVERRIACFREALRRDSSDRKVHEEFALELLDALEAKREPCAGAGVAACEADAARSSERLGAGGGYRGLVIAARITARKGDVLRAVTELLANCPATPSAAECLELAVELASRLPDKELIRRAEQRFIALACEVPARCSSAHTFVAEKLEASGDLPGALDHFTQAAREAPTAARWLKVADAAARAGKATAKRAALSEVAVLAPLSPKDERERDRLEREGTLALPRGLP
jgi:tetratricopeptide (TPR) repeat protein